MRILSANHEIVRDASRQPVLRPRRVLQLGRHRLPTVRVVSAKQLHIETQQTGRSDLDTARPRNRDSGLGFLHDLRLARQTGECASLRRLEELDVRVGWLLDAKVRRPCGFATATVGHARVQTGVLVAVQFGYRENANVGDGNAIGFLDRDAIAIPGDFRFGCANRGARKCGHRFGG